MSFEKIDLPKRRKTYSAATPEGKVKNILREFFDTHGVYYYMPVPGRFSRSGIADFVCCIRGRFFAIETKREGQRATEAQLADGNKVLESGGEFFVVAGEQEAKGFIAKLKRDFVLREVL